MLHTIFAPFNKKWHYVY